MTDSGKVDLSNLRRACKNMIALIDEITNPRTDSSGARTLGFPMVAAAIRRELADEPEDAA